MVLRSSRLFMSFPGIREKDMEILSVIWNVREKGQLSWTPKFVMLVLYRITVYYR